MQISYFHVAGDVPEGREPHCAVVIDILRATTTIAWALHNGAQAIETFADLEELKTRASNFPRSSILLLGERGGGKLEGFDLGNSPVAVIPEVVSGKRLFMSTTNGTRALNRVRDVSNLYTMALPNRLGVAKRLIEDRCDELWIIGSGWEGSYSLEDSLAAGALVSKIMNLSTKNISVANDELNSALALWERWENNPEACLRKATHGQRLMSIGNHEADFHCCAQLDQLDIVPTQIESGVLSIDSLQK